MKMENVQTKAPDKRKENLVSFRLSDKERALLQTKVDSSSVKISDFLRQCIMDQVPGLLDDLKFVLGFFQKNAENLKIDATEADRFRKILQKLKELREK